MSGAADRHEYQVLAAPSIDKLVVEVEKALNDGWSLQGGVAVSNEGCAQAVTRSQSLFAYERMQEQLAAEQEAALATEH